MFKKVKKLHIIIGFSVLIVVLIGLAIYFSYSPSYAEWGIGPEFSITLVDNAENDYIDIKFVNSGAGFYKCSFIRPENTQIAIYSENKTSLLFAATLPSESERMYPGENIRVVSDSDIIENGKTYRVELAGMASYGLLFSKQIVV